MVDIWLLVFVLLVMLVLVLVSWLVVGWMMWLMCVKYLMCWWWIPLLALDGLGVFKFLWGPWVHNLWSWSSCIWRLRCWNPHLWWYIGTHSYGVLGVLESLGLKPTYMVAWWPLDIIWSLMVHLEMIWVLESIHMVVCKPMIVGAFDMMEYLVMIPLAMESYVIGLKSMEIILFKYYMISLKESL